MSTPPPPPANAEDPAKVERQAQRMLQQLGVSEQPDEAGDVSLDALKEALMRQHPSTHPGIAEETVEEIEGEMVLSLLTERLLDDQRAPAAPWLRRWGLTHATEDSLRAPAWPQDTSLAQLLSKIWQSAVQGNCDEWELGGPRLCVALVVLLDRGSRLLRAGKREAFANDLGALTLAQAVVAAGEDQMLSPIERFFLYLPYYADADVASQVEGARLFLALHAAHPTFLGGLAGKFATCCARQEALLKRFGHFPWDNHVKRRRTTPEEEAFLTEIGANGGGNKLTPPPAVPEEELGKEESANKNTTTTITAAEVEAEVADSVGY